jgi:hypothetical protein
MSKSTPDADWKLAGIEGRADQLAAMVWYSAATL